MKSLSPECRENRKIEGLVGDLEGAERSAKSPEGAGERSSRRKRRRRTNIDRNWRMCFLVRNPSLKLARM